MVNDIEKHISIQKLWQQEDLPNVTKLSKNDKLCVNILLQFILVMPQVDTVCDSRSKRKSQLLELQYSIKPQSSIQPKPTFFSLSYLIPDIYL